MVKIRHGSLLAGFSLAAMAGLGGCATQAYVDKHVAALEARHATRADQLDKTSREALERAQAAGKLAEGKVVGSVVLSDDAMNFQPAASDLSPAAEARLTELAQLTAENSDVYLEIQGHTDASGPEALNYRLGADRADAVRRFLHKQGIASNRMSTISYGEEAPLMPNDSSEGMAANRRVVVVVLN
jgi:peptidoglycan-associated lipoprotein